MPLSGILRAMSAPGHTALGAWSGGRYMHFGEALDEDRYVRLLRPDEGIHTVVTADVYGAGEADLAVGRALAGLPRESFSLVGAVGHDFYGTQRDGSKGFPRFTALRGAGEYAGYLRDATERSLARCGVDHFDVLLLHNPDRVGLHVARRLGGDGRAARGRPLQRDRRRARARQRLHARRDRLPGALRRPDRLGDADPQPARALAGPARAPGLRAPRRARARAGRRLRRAVPRRRARRGLARRDRPPQLPGGRLGRRRARAARRAAPDRRSPRPDAAAAVGRLDARPARRRVRRPDAHPGGRAGRQDGRGQARRARRRPRAGPSWTRPSWPRSPPSATTPAA